MIFSTFDTLLEAGPDSQPPSSSGIAGMFLSLVTDKSPCVVHPSCAVQRRLNVGEISSFPGPDFRAWKPVYLGSALTSW